MRTLIYVLQDIDGKVRYVGKTASSIEKRLREHISEAKTGKQSHKANWIRSCGRNGYIPLIRTIEVVENDDGSLQERYWIDRYNRQGCELTNGTLGGEGCNATEEVKRKISETQKKNPNRSRLGAIVSEETKRKMSLSRTGKRHSEEAKKKMSIAKIGKPRKSHSEETKKIIALKATGRRHSVETKRKMSVSAFLRNQPSVENTERSFQ